VPAGALKVSSVSVVAIRAKIDLTFAGKLLVKGDGCGHDKGPKTVVNCPNKDFVEGVRLSAFSKL
jgi:hypothetical protein